MLFLARKYSSKIRDDWHTKFYKNVIMFEALQAKFTQHPKLKILLLSTDNRQLIEHTKNDNYWGDGGDGSGENKLGQLLMDIRHKLQVGEI